MARLSQFPFECTHDKQRDVARKRKGGLLPQNVQTQYGGDCHCFIMLCQTLGTLAIFAFIRVQIHAFNLDLNSPVVYQSNQPGDYFGFSLALYPGSSEPNDVPWMMVGAPKANDSRIAEHGVVYKCKIKDGCSKINFAYLGNSEVQTNWAKSLLGSAMDMTADRYVVCSPNLKFRLLGDNVRYRMYGICFWGTPKDLDNNNILTPLQSRNGFMDTVDRVIPLYYWGQAGLSTALYKSSGGLHELLIGAPSVYNWIGSVVSYRDDSDLSGGLAKRRRRVPLNVFNIGPHIPNPKNDLQIWKFGYVGYAVAVGNFFAQSEVAYVAGAPSTQPAGKVFVYTVTIGIDQKPTFIMKQVLEGKLIGEKFGTSVAAGDINGDGLDDLVIGAPYFNSASYESQNEGKVVTYFGSHTQNFWTPKLNPEIIGTVRNGRLGTTIACLGDLDLDGKKDFAIAAPYEGSGVVYIYYGSTNGLYESQKVVGSEINPQISRFGFGISRAQDLDKNNYGDIAIGAYKSGTVVLLRASPVVDIVPRINILGEKLREDTKGFQAEVCVRYDGQHPPPQIKITMRLTMDPGNYRIYRENADQTLTTTENTFDIKYPEFCRRIQFVLKNDIKNRIAPIEILGEFSIAKNSSKRVPINIGGDNRVLGQDGFCSQCPVVRFNPNTGNNQVIRSASIGFDHGCRIENQCEADLSLTTQFVDPSNPGEQITNFIVGEANNVLLRIFLQNKGDPAFNTKVSVKVPDLMVSLPPNCNLNATSKVYDCDAGNPLKNVSRVLDFVIDIQKSIDKQNVDLEVEIIVETATKVANPRLLTAKPRLVLGYEADVTVYGTAKEVDYRFELKTESKAEATSKVSPAFKIKMEKVGKSPLQDVALKVNIPVSSGSTKFVHLSPPQFYIGSKLLSCQPNEFIQQSEVKSEVREKAPDGLQQPAADASLPSSPASALGGSRRKRQTGTLGSAEFQWDTEKYPLNRTLFINCSQSQWACTQLICTGPLLLGNVPAELDLKLNLDMSQIESDLGQSDIIAFSATATVEVITPKSVKQPTVQYPDVAFVTAILLRRAPAGKVATWVIVISAIGGILLLVILVTALTKAGFFQRKTRDELLLKKRQVRV
ncbi:Hypothetical predicted protein [Cloeon dipterum]|uniref:Integrin alpha second immunoglobulin-like domain-containing protein n=1 Tax=Cloeon dipterum TaxID=197152 RepID=A0A8S1CAP3_9INSE|nr:Hypothetical predicted protein [Cloeon dipterum]